MSPTSRGKLCATALAVLVATAAAAQEASVAAPAGSSAPAPATGAPDESGKPALTLTLDDAVDLALDHSFGLRVARNDLASSQSGLRAAENAYDFKLTAAFDDGHAYQRNGTLVDPTDPTLSILRSYFDEEQRFSFRLSKDLKIGGSVELQSALTRTRLAGDPVHAQSTSVAWTIPLIAGRGRRVATASLVNAQSALRRDARSLVESEMTEVVRVVRSFYQVLRSESVLEIDRAAVDRARENHRTFQLRLEEGLVTPIDVSRAERELRGRENAVVADEESVQAARDALLQELALPLDTTLDLKGAAPFAKVDVQLGAATEEALANRADLKSQRESLQLATLARDVARSSTRPKLDLTLSAGIHSLQGDEASEWFKLAHDDRWAGGVGLSYTFGERTDDENLARAIIAEDSSRIRLDELQRRIVLDVRDAVRNVRSLERQVDLLEENVRLAEESLRLAQLQLEEDLIRTTDLLQIQDELVRAQTDRVNALYDHAIAVVSLDLAMGRYRVGDQSRTSPFLRGQPPSPDVPVLPRVRLSSEEGAQP